MQLNECIHGHEKDGNVGEQKEEDTFIDVDPDTLATMHIYPMHGGLLLISDSELQKQQEEADKAPPTSEQSPAQIKAKEMPPFAFFLLVLFFFLLFDMADSTLTAVLTPTATITITPQVQTISTTATLTVGGEGADIQGRVVAPLTVTQEQTVQATGKGHQNARAATGILTFFNGSFISQTVDAGTVYTGSDGVQVTTIQTVTIPQANPPYVGQTTVTAHAIIAGESGNIQVGDINITTATLQVRNSQFANGQDARDFTYITKGDIQQVVSTLIPTIRRSEQSALTAQLINGESFLSPVCTPRTITNHAPGDEAVSVTVSVSETCNGLAYNQEELQRAGTRILQTQRAASFVHFRQVGTIHLAIISQTVNGEKATMKVQLTGTWVYQINQQHIAAIIQGKPCLAALHLIEDLPGVQAVRITGIPDNQELPTDTAHIHLAIFFTVS